MQIYKYIKKVGKQFIFIYFIELLQIDIEKMKVDIIKNFTWLKTSIKKYSFNSFCLFIKSFYSAYFINIFINAFINVVNFSLWPCC